MTALGFASKGQKDLNIPLIDTHAHICDSSFDIDLPAVLKRAEQSGIQAIIAVGENIEDARKNLELAEDFPILKPAAGLYPAYTDLDATKEMLEFIQGNRHRFYAVGEVGLDFWLIKEEEKREIQKEVFSLFIGLSMNLSLPLNVHSRSAGHHALNILLAHNAKSVQMHAFDGKASYVLPAVEAGFFFSIPPSVVRSPQKQKLVKAVPIESLLLETDSPVLGPNPKIRNEPENLLVAARAIADIKGLSLEETLNIVKENTLRLYDLSASEIRGSSEGGGI